MPGASSPTISKWTRSSPGAASACTPRTVRLIGVWKPKEPITGASSGSPRRRRRASPAARSAGGGKGTPIGTTRTRSPGSARSAGSSSRTTAAAHSLCTSTPRCRRSKVRWAGRAKIGAVP